MKKRIKKVSDKKEVAFDNVSIKLMGEFNPSSFDEAFVNKNNFFPKEDFDSFFLEHLSEEFCKYSSPFLTMFMTREFFEAGIMEINDRRKLRDFIVRILKSLDELKITSVGINRIIGIQFANIEEADVFYEKYMPSKHMDSILKNPLSRGLMVVSERNDDKRGSIFVEIERSKDDLVTIFLNDHMELSETGFEARINEALKHIKDDMTDRLEYLFESGLKIAGF